MIHVSDLAKVLTTFAEGLAGLLGHKIQPTQLQILMGSVLGQVATAPATSVEEATPVRTRVTAEVHSTPKKATREPKTPTAPKIPTAPRKKLDVSTPLNRTTAQKAKTTEHEDMDLIQLESNLDISIEDHQKSPMKQWWKTSAP